MNSLPQVMRQHLGLLGRGTVADYLQWCRSERFFMRLDKDETEREAELTRLREREPMRKYRAHVRRPARLLTAMLDAACGMAMMPDVEATPRVLGPLREFLLTTVDETQRAFARRLVLHLLRESPELLFAPIRKSDRDTSYLVAVLRISRFCDQTVRPMGDWRPRTRNLARQFRSLLDHLLARWPVVDCLANTFLSRGDSTEVRRHRQWFVRLGQGESPRALDLPLPFNRRMAHHFQFAPTDYSVPEALRWAQVHGLGGDKDLCDALRGTLLTRSFDNDGFWAGVLCYFIAHSSFDRKLIPPAIDYLHQLRFGDTTVLDENGHIKEVPAPDPELTMTGRCPVQLQRRVREWCDDVHEASPQEWRHNKPLPTIDLPEFRHEEGSIRRGNRRVWVIRQLNSSVELASEGRRMRHCVAGYSSSCRRGRSSIWSMSVLADSGSTPVLTIEVDPRQRLVRQALGLENEDPTEEHVAILRKWATKAKLQISPYAWD